MELKVEVKIIIDSKEVYERKLPNDMIIGSIGFAIEDALNEVGICKSCLVTTRVVRNVEQSRTEQA